jgi:multidrug resistance efflux pump
MSEDETQKQETEAPPAEQEGKDPVRKWTLILLGLSAIFLVWYLVSDRITPYTTQARVHAFVVPIAAEISGTVSEVAVVSNQLVKQGDILFRIDKTRYELDVETAEANLEAARQATGASTAAVDAAEAQVEAASAGLVRAQKDADRMMRIRDEDPGAISQRRIDSALATLDVSVAQLAAAEASLEQARQNLGQTGEDNSRILQAQSMLDQAVVNLQRTDVVAPDDGIVTDVRVDRGNFAQAGAPLMTFLATKDVWIQADFTENNLGNIKRGDPVEIVFDALPGTVVKGTVRTTGFGVNVDSAPLGSLPTIDNDRSWLRDAQRFSVLVDFELPSAEDRLGIRIGAQASVRVYTSGNWLFNTIGRIRMWIVSKLTYAY